MLAAALGRRADEFDATIIRLAVLRVVGGHGLRVAVALCRQPVCTDAHRHQLRLHGIRALLREREIMWRASGVVGVSVDLELQAWDRWPSPP